MAASAGELIANGGGMGYASEDESACSTPFVSAPSSPARDRDTTSFSAAFASVPVPFSPARDLSFSAAGWFRSAPASPGRGGGASTLTADEYGRELGLEFDDFDFDVSRCPSPATAAMSSADELFANGQIRPMRLLRPQALPPHDGDVAAGDPPPQAAPSEQPAPPAGADERGRVRSRSARRRYRSLSPFRARWLSPQPATAAKSVEPAATGEAEAEAGQSAASRSSSSSSTASSASSSSSSSSRSHNRRWRFLKDILHRSKSSDGGGGGEQPPPPPAPSKRSPSPSPASRGRGRARRSAHARLYESRRAEAEEMRRRTFLPYRQGLPLLGCLGLGSRGYVAMHGLAAAGKARP